MKQLLNFVTVLVATIALCAVPQTSQAAVDGGNGGSYCSRSVSTSKPTSTSVKFTWTIKCNQGVGYIYHGMTLSRSGKNVTKTSYCSSPKGTLKTCTKSITISDIAGSQKYTGINEWCAGWEAGITSCTTPLGKWVHTENM